MRVTDLIARLQAEVDAGRGDSAVLLCDGTDTYESAERNVVVVDEASSSSYRNWAPGTVVIDLTA